MRIVVLTICYYRISRLHAVHAPYSGAEVLVFSNAAPLRVVAERWRRSKADCGTVVS